MKTNISRRALFLVQGALIAAFYIVATLLASALDIAYGPVQFRISEALTILPVFTPAAIPGLAVGCLLSNLGSPYGIADWVCGTSATLLAAVATRMLRGVRFRGLPVLAALPPVLFNAAVVGAEIAFFLPEGFSMAGFLGAALSVGAGELAVCVLLSFPLAALLERTGAAKKLFSGRGE